MFPIKSKQFLETALRNFVTCHFYYFLRKNTNFLYFIQRKKVYDCKLFYVWKLFCRNPKFINNCSGFLLYRKNEWNKNVNTGNSWNVYKKKKRKVIYLWKLFRIFVLFCYVSLLEWNWVVCYHFSALRYGIQRATTSTILSLL